MRTIKFRIWDNLTNEMYYDALVGNCRGESTIPCVYLNDVGWAHTDNCVVEQFTGLLDKNGAEIYEGDILVCQKWIGGNWIDYCIERGYVEMKLGAFGLHRKQGYYRPFKDWLEDYEFEVIGNIHDNKELL